MFERKSYYDFLFMAEIYPINKLDVKKTIKQKKKEIVESGNTSATKTVLFSTFSIFIRFYFYFTKEPKLHKHMLIILLSLLLLINNLKF